MSFLSSVKRLRSALGVLSLAAVIAAPAAMATNLPKIYSTGEQITKPWQLSRLVEYTNARKPPLVEFTDKAGKPVDFRQHRGNLVMLNIWATWCGPCWKELPELEEVKTHFAGKPLVIQPMNIDEDQSVVLPMITKRGMDHIPTWLDAHGNMTEIVTIGTVPATYFLDGNGNLVGWIRGYIDWLEPDVLEYVDKLIEKYADPQFEGA